MTWITFQQPDYDLFWMQSWFQDVLGDDGIFLYPTHPTAAYYHNQMFTKTGGVMYTMVFNVLGLPSTHVPLGLNKDGIPIGIQVSTVWLYWRINMCCSHVRYNYLIVTTLNTISPLAQTSSKSFVWHISPFTTKCLQITSMLH